MSFIRIESVSKSFGTVKAVDQVSLTVNKGEVFSLLGGSGSGKSTLLRILAGLEDPDEGRIFLDGQDITELPPYRRPLNLMFQSYALFPHLSVAQNVAYGLKQEKIPRKEIKERVERFLNLVQLSPYQNRKPQELSGGQQQRVALARALIKQPKVLLLDEPLGALDRQLREKTQFELINLQEELGITFVVVTHDQEEAMILSDRMAIMDQGKIQQIGTATELYEYPCNRAVAEFLGEANIFEGVFSDIHSDYAMIEVNGIKSPIHAKHSLIGPKGMNVSLVLRPEKLDMHKEKPKQDYNLIQGTIEDIAYRGDQTLYRIKPESIEGGNLPKTIQVLRMNYNRTEDEAHYTWYDPIWLSWPDSGAAVLVG